MEFKDWFEKNRDWIIALLFVIGFGVFAGCRFDYYYDLNDDVLMKDILAGVYTGTPEGHNIQMLWPVSAFISLLYRIAGRLPWYGAFLCACHFGCFFLILRRSLTFAGTLPGKLAAAVPEALIFAGLFLPHLVYAQYTVTCTLLGGTAAFLFYTTDITLSPGEFIKKNILPALLAVLAFLIRSEMLLLVLPLICAAGVLKWAEEEKIFTTGHVVKYLSVIGMILAGLLLGQAVHMAAYGGQEWRAFTRFFNNRTELYDFQQIPSYEEHRDFYESVGLSESEKILLDNYNFGMDEEIDENVVGKIAAYAGKIKSEDQSFVEKLSEKLGFYRYRFIHGREDTGSDYPWNYAVILGYVTVFLLSIPGKGFSEEASWGREYKTERKGLSRVKNGLGAILRLAFLFAVRTALWMFILMRGRDPERITHSLYLMELCILAAMIFIRWRQIPSPGIKRAGGFLGAAAFGLLAIVILPSGIRETLAQQARRETVNAPYRELYARLSDEENRENFYFIDVYSSVGYSEKMFEDVDNSLDNYDIMGGWACKSPLQKKKLAVFGIRNMEAALKDRDNVYFVRSISEDMDWLFEYYEGHNTPVEATLVETVAGIFEIYKVRGADT